MSLALNISNVTLILASPPLPEQDLVPETKNFISSLGALYHWYLFVLKDAASLKLFISAWEVARAES